VHAERGVVLLLLKGGGLCRNSFYGVQIKQFQRAQLAPAAASWQKQVALLLSHYGHHDCGISAAVCFSLLGHAIETVQIITDWQAGSWDSIRVHQYVVRSA
jgi:hypothetical protein